MRDFDFSEGEIYEEKVTWFGFTVYVLRIVRCVCLRFEENDR